MYYLMIHIMKIIRNIWLYFVLFYIYEIYLILFLIYVLSLYIQTYVYMY